MDLYSAFDLGIRAQEDAIEAAIPTLIKELRGYVGYVDRAQVRVCEQLRLHWIPVTMFRGFPRLEILLFE